MFHYAGALLGLDVSASRRIMCDRMSVEDRHLIKHLL